MGIFSEDIVRDILARVVQASQGSGGGFSDSMAEQIERQVRAEWGGVSVYIGRRKLPVDKIIDDWNSGKVSIKGLATRYGCTERRIRQIVAD